MANEGWEVGTWIRCGNRRDHGRLLIFWPEDSEIEEPPHTEKALCNADSCDGTPIRFVDLALGSDELVATLVDLSGAEVQRIDPPVAAGDSTAEWTWDAALEDPIGSTRFTSRATAPRPSNTPSPSSR